MKVVMRKDCVSWPSFFAKISIVRRKELRITINQVEAQTPKESGD